MAQHPPIWLGCLLQAAGQGEPLGPALTFAEAAGGTGRLWPRTPFAFPSLRLALQGHQPAAKVTSVTPSLPAADALSLGALQERRTLVRPPLGCLPHALPMPCAFAGGAHRQPSSTWSPHVPVYTAPCVCPCVFVSLLGCHRGPPSPPSPPAVVIPTPIWLHLEQEVHRFAIQCHRCQDIQVLYTGCCLMDDLNPPYPPHLPVEGTVGLVWVLEGGVGYGHGTQHSSKPKAQC